MVLLLRIGCVWISPSITTFAIRTDVRIRALYKVKTRLSYDFRSTVECSSWFDNDYLIIFSSKSYDSLFGWHQTYYFTKLSQRFEIRVLSFCEINSCWRWHAWCNFPCHLHFWKLVPRPWLLRIMSRICLKPISNKIYWPYMFPSHELT